MDRSLALSLMLSVCYFLFVCFFCSLTLSSSLRLSFQNFSTFNDYARHVDRLVSFHPYLVLVELHSERGSKEPSRWQQHQ